MYRQLLQQKFIICEFAIEISVENHYFLFMYFCCLKNLNISKYKIDFSQNTTLFTLYFITSTNKKSFYVK